jgi:hypothetical protein
MTAKQIEYAVAMYYGVRKNNIVPNISWGLGIHECDLLIVEPCRWATEVEIKISISDLKADAKKWHHHESELIRSLYFAIPTSLFDKALPFIPERAGVLTVDEFERITCVRYAEPNPAAVKITDTKLLEILRLGNMRTWGLRKRLLQTNKLQP